MTGIPPMSFENSCNGNNCKIEINLSLQGSASKSNISDGKGQAVGRNGFLGIGAFVRHGENGAIKNDLSEETINSKEEYESESESDTENITYNKDFVRNLDVHKGLGAETFYQLSVHNKKRKYANGHLKVKKQERFKHVGKNNKMLPKTFGIPKYIFGQIPEILSLFPVGSYFERETQEASENMENELNRFTTFYNYRGFGNHRLLALYGFYHDPSVGPLFTKCFKCNTEHSTWSQNDDVLSEHRRMSPNCPYLMEVENNGYRDRTEPFSTPPTSSAVSGVQRYISNVENSSPTVGRAKQQERLAGEDRSQTREQTSASNTASASQHIPGAGLATQATMGAEDVEEPEQILSVIAFAKHPRYRSTDARIKSFHGADAFPFQNPRQMAETGFFYTGCADLARCFYCGIGFRDWAKGDDPWIEHARWSPECQYVKEIKGENFVASVQRKQQQDMIFHSSANRDLNPAKQEKYPGTEKLSDQDAEIVSTLREMGFSVEHAHEAVLSVRQQTCSPVVTVEEVINFLVDGEGRKTSTSSSVGSVVMQATDTCQSETIPSGSSRVCNVSMSSSVNVIREENQRLKEMQTCKICQEQPVEITFLPCGHLVCCKTCGVLVQSCPLCGYKITGTVKTYMP